jgi:hypothetical protein
MAPRPAEATVPRKVSTQLDASQMMGLPSFKAAPLCASATWSTLTSPRASCRDRPTLSANRHPAGEQGAFSWRYACGMKENADAHAITRSREDSVNGGGGPSTSMPRVTAGEAGGWHGKASTLSAATEEDVTRPLGSAIDLDQATGTPERRLRRLLETCDPAPGTLLRPEHYSRSISSRSSK